MKYTEVYEAGLYTADMTRQEVREMLTAVLPGRWENILRQETFWRDGSPQYYGETTEHQEEAYQRHNDLFRIEISGDIMHIACQMTEGYSATILPDGKYEYNYGSSLDYEYTMTPEQQNAIKSWIMPNRQDIEEYRNECGSQAAADLLLLLGADGYAGDYEEYNKLWETLESEAQNG